MENERAEGRMAHARVRQAETEREGRRERERAGERGRGRGRRVFGNDLPPIKNGVFRSEIYPTYLTAKFLRKTAKN